MIVGSTGSRHGMSAAQSMRFGLILTSSGATSLHHGDCRGADEQAHAIARGLKLWIVGHPPTSSGLRAFTDCDEWREPAPFLTRDRTIVMETNLLVATPHTSQEQLRSGTWATIRIARRQSLPHVIIDPDGNTHSFNLNGVGQHGQMALPLYDPASMGLSDEAK